ncbi:MAG: hypothetical protein E6Q97_35480 [Desulfurellales bacterium]|nr:MAG: hypothetical protein E6Q97_35480 [Desulfurellales bacterium]
MSKLIRKPAKPIKLSNNDKAAQRLAALLVSGRTLTIPAAWGYITVGAYTPAVGAGGFAVYGYRTDNFSAAEFTGPCAAEAASQQAVAICGSTRVFEACRKAK